MRLLNHFSGNRIWKWGEALLQPFASRIGFRPDFPIETYVSNMNWNIVNIRPVNVLGLSRLVHFKNSDSN